MLVAVPPYPEVSLSCGKAQLDLRRTAARALRYQEIIPERSMLMSKKEDPTFAQSQVLAAALLIFDMSGRSPIPLDIIFHLKGTIQAVYTAMLLRDNLNLSGSLCKVLYPMTGKRFHATGMAIERNIRSVIAFLWENKQAELFLFFHSVMDEAPTAGQFVTYLMLRLIELEGKELPDTLFEPDGTEIPVRLKTVKGAGEGTAEYQKVCDEHDAFVKNAWNKAVEAKKKREQTELKDRELFCMDQLCIIGFFLDKCEHPEEIGFLPRVDDTEEVNQQIRLF